MPSETSMESGEGHCFLISFAILVYFGGGLVFIPVRHLSSF